MKKEYVHYCVFCEKAIKSDKKNPEDVTCPSCGQSRWIEGRMDKQDWEDL